MSNVDPTKKPGWTQVLTKGIYIYLYGHSKTRSTLSTRQIRKTSRTKHTTHKTKKMSNKSTTKRT